MVPFQQRYLFIILLFIQFITTLFYARELTNVKYSFIGDEYSMYQYAQQILEGKRVINPFSLDGVFGTNPILGSYYQAAVMKVFSNDIYGWKLSSLIIIFPLGLLLFYTVKRISNLYAAFFTLFAVNTSFYFYSFFQIGYLNNLSLLFLVIIMYLVTFIDPSKKKQPFLPYILLGIATGLSWYFYVGKVYIFIVSLYILLINKLQRGTYKHFAVFAVLSTALIAMSFMSTHAGHSDLGISKTLLQREFSDNSGILKNAVYPFILQHYSPVQTHYLPHNAYVDQITASLATIGMLLLILSIVSKRFRLYEKFHIFLPLFVLVSVVIGATSPYTYPPVTRGIHYVPFYIIFAVYCLLYIQSFLQGSFKFKLIFWSTITVVVIFLNIFYIGQPVHHTSTQKIFSVIYHTQPQAVIFKKNTSCFNFEAIDTLLNGYVLPVRTVLTNKISPNMCKKNTIILSCSPEECNTKAAATYEKKVYLYKL